jgi:hypothetical protein
MFLLRYAGRQQIEESSLKRRKQATLKHYTKSQIMPVIKCDNGKHTGFR